MEYIRHRDIVVGFSFKGGLTTGSNISWMPPFVSSSSICFSCRNPFRMRSRLSSGFLYLVTVKHEGIKVSHFCTTQGNPGARLATDLFVSIIVWLPLSSLALFSYISASKYNVFLLPNKRTVHQPSSGRSILCPRLKEINL